MRNARLAILVALSVTVLSAAAMAQSDGADAFKRCAGCHKDTGMGVPGYAPPLAAHIPDIGKSPIAPEEVKAQRENRLTAEQVLAIRGKLGLN